MAKLSLQEVQFLAHALAQQKLGFDEPIPDFSTRYPNILESCLIAPFQTYDKKELYPKFIDKASILFYLMVKNHPFLNGNKRVALTTLFVFLAKNKKKWLRVKVETLYNFAVDVAKSRPKDRDKMLTYISTFIETFMVEY